MKQDIIKLQKYVQESGIDAYLVFTSDDHGSEYIVDHFKTREFLSGFTGSAGTLLVIERRRVSLDGRKILHSSGKRA